MLGSIARAGRHVACARSALSARPGLVTGPRRGYGTALPAEKPAPLLAVEGAGRGGGEDGSMVTRSLGGEEAVHTSEQHKQDRTSTRTPQASSNTHKTAHIARANRHVESIVARRRRERELRAEQNGLPPKQWTEIEALLLKNLPKTNRRSPKRTMLVKIPLQAERAYQHSPSIVFTEILLKYKCMPKLLHYYSTPGGAELQARYIILNGPPSTIDAARATLYSLYNTLLPVSAAEAKNVQASPNSKVVTTSWSETRRRHESLLSEIVLPRDMTVIVFAQYIDQLTSTKPSRLMRKAADRESSELESHQDQVGRKLVELFQKDEYRACWSLHAALSALRFLGKHRLLPQQRQVLQLLLRSDSMKTSELFGPVLETAAGAQDLKSFLKVLQIMVAEGLRPGFEAWMLFARMMQPYDADVSDAIFKTMKDRGFLDTAPARVSMAETLCKQHYAEWIESQGQPEQFLDIYDQLWGGAKWFTASTAHDMLTYHASRGQLDQALAVLALYSAKGGKYTSAHLEVLLSNARKYGSMRTAKDAVLECLLQQPDMVLSQHAYTHLFMAAVKQCYFHTACMLWQVAFARGHVSLVMQERVEKCLHLSSTMPETDLTDASAAKQETDTPAERPSASRRLGFDRATGQAILQITGDIQQSSSIDNGQHDVAALPAHKQVHLFRQLLQVPQRHKVTKALDVLLQDAYARDTKDRKARRQRSLAEVMRVAMDPVSGPASTKAADPADSSSAAGSAGSDDLWARETQ